MSDDELETIEPDDILPDDGSGDAVAPGESRRSRADSPITLIALVAGVVALAATAMGVGLSLTRDDSGTTSAGAAATTTTLPPVDDTETTTPTTPPETTPATVEVPDSCVDTLPVSQGNGKTYDAAPEMTIDQAKTYTATLETSCGRIVIALDAANAPVATNTFVFLARDLFYDGLTFHRVVGDFVIQGGDPAGDGSGGPGFTVAGEAPADGYPLGSLAAAKTATDPAGTMGSQFFIVTGENGTTLPPEYARFGVVTEGLDVAQTIEALAQGDGPPVQPVYIFSVVITES